MATAANYSFMDRAQLMAEIEESWQELDGLVRGLSEDDWHRPLAKEDPDADAWVVADGIAHIAAWKQNSLKIAMAQAEAGSEPVDEYPSAVLGFDTAEFNREVLLEWRDQPITSVLARHRAAHHGLLAALDALPDDRLLAGDRPRRWLRPAIRHIGDHIGALREAVGKGSG